MLFVGFALARFDFARDERFALFAGFVLFVLFARFVLLSRLDVASATPAFFTDVSGAR